MKTYLRVLVAAFALGCNSPSYANFSMSPSGTTTAFAIDAANQGTSLCAAASTECPASVPINTAGAPLFTTAVPGVVSQGTAANLNATVVGTGTFAVQAALNTETTKVIGTVNQGTSPWVDSITTWAGGTLGAMANFGVSPGAVLVPGVNASAFPGSTTATLTGWTTATGGNATQTLFSTGGWASVILQLDQTSTLTGGAITIEGTYDGTNWVTVPVAQVLNPNTLANLTNPYTLVASTNQPFLILTQGYQSVRIRLSTTITGTATVTPFVTLLPYNPVLGALLNPLAAGSAIIGKVGIDQTTPGVTNLVQLGANQSVNVAQFGGVSTSTGQVAASTAPVTATNTALVVDLRPDSPGIIALGTNTAANSVPVVLNTTPTIANGSGVLIAPTSGATASPTVVAGGSAVSSAVLKNAAGNLYDVYATCTSACWLMIFNAASAPSNGATTAGIAASNMQHCIPISAGGVGSVENGALPEAFTTGITAVISSTACATLTLATTGFIHGRVQ